MNYKIKILLRDALSQQCVFTRPPVRETLLNNLIVLGEMEALLIRGCHGRLQEWFYRTPITEIECHADSNGKEFCVNFVPTVRSYNLLKIELERELNSFFFFFINVNAFGLFVVQVNYPCPCTCITPNVMDRWFPICSAQVPSCEKQEEIWTWKITT